MKCKDCDCCKQGWFSYRPKDYVCIGVKHPFVISDINHECTEYKNWNETKLPLSDLIVIEFTNGKEPCLTAKSIRGNNVDVKYNLSGKCAVEKYLDIIGEF